MTSIAFFSNPGGLNEPESNRGITALASLKMVDPHWRGHLQTDESKSPLFFIGYVNL
jgi:hypothetical protein